MWKHQSLFFLLYAFLSACLLIEAAAASRGGAQTTTTVLRNRDDHDGWKDNPSITETPELIANKLREFDILLADLPKSKKTHVLSAEAKCPDHTSDFKLAFLRCVHFDAPSAVNRYCSYWKKRVEIFGVDRAFKPLTLQNMQEDRVALQQGVVSVIERPGARSNYIYLRGSKADKTKYSSMNLVRTLWYATHSLIEDEQVQKQGLIILDYAHGTKLTEIDLRVGKLMKQSFNECLPVRVVAHHWCNPPSWINTIRPLIVSFTPRRIRKRLHIHRGTPNKVSSILQSKFNFLKEDLPPEVGGSYQLDISAWLERRLSNGK